MAQLKLTKSGENYKIYTDGKADLIMIENVRISFPAVGHTKAQEGEDGNTTHSYAATPMLPKSTHLAAKTAFVQIMNDLIKANDAKVLTENKCMKDGDNTDRAEYEGHWVIASKEANRPNALDARGKRFLDLEKIKDGAAIELILDKIDGVFYGGVTVNILLRPWFFNGKAKGKAKTYPKRICCGFMAVQHVEDTPSFGQGRIDDTGIWGDTTGEGGDDVPEDDDDDL